MPTNSRGQPGGATDSSGETAYSGPPQPFGASARQTASVWLAWLAGASALAAVVLVGSHLTEAREFVELAHRSRPAWFGLAVLLQAATYVAQGEVWRLIGREAGHPLSPGAAVEISLAKQFVDQALPSAGLSGSALAATALEARQLPRGAALAAMALNMVAYNAAYIVGLALALVLAAEAGEASRFVVIVAVAFAAFGVVMAALLFELAGRRRSALARTLGRVPPLGRLIELVASADPDLVRDPRLLAGTTVPQLAIIALDAGTMMALVASLGATVPAGGIFVSFMIASLFRTMGVLPAGLGTFEASAVVTLRMAGATVPVALAATLLFRGLSFWLPMLPGFWCSRRVAVRPAARTGRGRTGLAAYWSVDPAELLHRLGSSASGLTAEEAARRLLEYGPGELRAEQPLSRLRVLGRQLQSPLLLLLVFAAGAAALTAEWTEAIIVLVIVLATVGLGYSREYHAQRAAAALQARVRTRASVVRGGRTLAVPREQVVPGDIVTLSAGSLVAADAVLLEADDFFVTESALTGESFPVEKHPGPVAAGAGVAARTNCVFLGTNVRSGFARCLVVDTGSATAYGAIAGRLARRPPDTDFDRGIRRFGYLLTSAMLVMTLLVFVAHMLRGRPPVETLLFSIALAVGLSPELLPAILSMNLARGAQMMARRGVLVRRLNAIENLGSMDVLCTDKTGTLTEGVIRVEGAYTPDGHPSPAVLQRAAWNAALETGLSNPLDDAILQALSPDLTAVGKVAEVPFDFLHRRVSVIVHTPAGTELVTKGAFETVFSVCTRLTSGAALDERGREAVTERFRDWSARGIRVLAVASRPIDERESYTRDDEHDLVFQGFVTFLDQPKPDVDRALRDLARLGVTVKLITGDNRLVAQHLAALVGMRAGDVVSGEDLRALDDAALWHVVERTDLFAEVDPNQKERIIVALRRSGHVVGFLGDGVNDAPAMHAADTSLSVDGAVDVAREAADFVLLERDLDVIRGGVEEGRRTFANTLKYILMATTANLGNMISMAAASLVLPFLPLLAGQILLNNLLSDVPAVGIADDSVDPEMVERPPRWDLRFIRRFMVEFALISSAFDALTFIVLLAGFGADVALFRTGWFVESVLTQLAAALVVRTRRLAVRSRPGRLLVWSTAAMAVVAAGLPFVPAADVLGFVPLPGALLGAVVGVTALYVGAVEVGKMGFYRTL
jgi:P-type Mg2+ transporter